MCNSYMLYLSKYDPTRLLNSRFFGNYFHDLPFFSLKD
jgi:hypothetical protein